MEQRRNEWATAVLACAVGMFAAAGLAQFQRPADTGQLLQARATLSTIDETRAVAFSPDGKTVATTAARAFQLWDAATVRAIASAPMAAPFWPAPTGRPGSGTSRPINDFGLCCEARELMGVSISGS